MQPYRNSLILIELNIYNILLFQYIVAIQQRLLGFSKHFSYNWSIVYSSWHVVVSGSVLIRGAVELLVCFVRVNIFEWYITRFAEIRCVFICLWFFFDVDGWYWRSLFFRFGIFSCVNKSCMSHYVAAVRGRVRARPASVYPITHRWAR